MLVSKDDVYNSMSSTFIGMPYRSDVFGQWFWISLEFQSLSLSVWNWIRVSTTKHNCVAVKNYNADRNRWFISFKCVYDAWTDSIPWAPDVMPIWNSSTIHNHMFVTVIRGIIMIIIAKHCFNSNVLCCWFSSVWFGSVRRKILANLKLG